MTSNGHYCLGFFAKDSWKDNFKDRFYKEANDKFSALLKASYDAQDEWASVHIHSLINPESSDDKKHVCYVGESLLSLFREKMGNNNGIILFSHTVLFPKDKVSLVNEVIQDDRVKKIFFAVLDEDSYVEHSKEREVKFSALVSGMLQTTLHISEFQQHLDESGYNFGLLYEIVKFR